MAASLPQALYHATHGHARGVTDDRRGRASVATAGVAEDWMYGKLAQSYVFDPAMREFFAEKNP